MRSNVIIPPEAQFLHARGWYGFRSATAGPAIAWTEWDERHRQWAITTLEPAMSLLDEQEQLAIVRHELAHILLGHFDPALMDCQRADRLIAADVAVNWFMDKNTRKSIDAKLDTAYEQALREQGAPEEVIDAMLGKQDTAEQHKFRGLVDPVAVLTDIGFSGDTYVPAAAVHARLHGLVDEQSDGDTQPLAEHYGKVCGGMRGDIPEGDRTRASALAGILANQIKNAEDAIKAGYGGAVGIGSSAGGMAIRPPHAPTPLWVRAVQEFARSVVRMALADKRSHNRPQPALRAMGYHAPTARPKWASVPDTVCLLVDTSGSMMDLLSQVRPAVEYLQQHGLTVRLIAGDTRVTLDEELKHGTPFPDLVGGGGTRIIPLWEAAEKYAPRAIVAFSDGYVDEWPGSEYASIEHLWVCGLESGVPFGKQVDPK